MRTIAIALAWMLWLHAAAAAEPDGRDCSEKFGGSAVTIICRHAAAGASVSIVPSSSARCGSPRPPRVEYFGANSLGRARAIDIDAGETGECRYADGRTVRVRAEREPDPLIGACNADPAVRFSLWLDGRKLRSRAPVYGRCAQPRPGWNYRIGAEGAFDCSDPDCVALADPASLPVDTLEYPPHGQASPQPGSLQRRLDRDPVCAAVERELRRDWRAFDVYAPRASTGALRRLNPFPRDNPEPPPADAALPAGAAFSYGRMHRHDFDFDNDGLLDRIYSNDTDGQGDAYFSPLLVQSGRAAGRFEPLAGEEAVIAVPCQWDPDVPSLRQCEDLRFASADTLPRGVQAVPAPAEVAPAEGLDAQRRFFRTRYTTTLPFAYRGITFVALYSVGLPSRDYLGVYRPGPGGAQQAVCLIHRVPPNM